MSPEWLYTILLFIMEYSSVVYIYRISFIHSSTGMVAGSVTYKD